MQERHSNMKLYFEELATTSKKFYIPYFTEFIPISSSTKILEIGCRDGGNLVPFAERGCQIKGIDISEYFINHAIEFFKEKNLLATFEVSDIFNVDSSSNKKFDLIIIADVIEHIYQKKVLYFLNSLHGKCPLEDISNFAKINFYPISPIIIYSLKWCTNGY
ncbi:MAG: class I SAM-dependent methyltransferase [Chitinophagaceae bacterium]